MGSPLKVRMFRPLVAASRFAYLRTDYAEHAGIELLVTGGRTKERLIISGVRIWPTSKRPLTRKNHVNPGATGSLRARRLLNSRFASV